MNIKDFVTVLLLQGLLFFKPECIFSCQRPVFIQLDCAMRTCTKDVFSLERKKLHRRIHFSGMKKDKEAVLILICEGTTLEQYVYFCLKCLADEISKFESFLKLLIKLFTLGKLQALDRLLRQMKIGKHRGLIFTQMTKMLDVLERFLNFHGYIYLRLDGATKVEQRQVGFCFDSTRIHILSEKKKISLRI